MFYIAASHQTSQSTSSRTPRRHLSWLRNSMRKTCPIFIPDQILPKTHEREHQATSTATASLDRSLKFTIPIPEDETSTHTVGSSVNQLEDSERQTNGRARRNNSFVSSNILTDFLNTTASLPVPLIIDNVDNMVNTRPRQYGRRSEVSPRVVSITTEISNGETVS